MAGKIRLAVLLSGGGTTLQNIIDLTEAGELPAEVAVVISSRKDAYGLVRAEKAGIPTAVVPSREYKRDWTKMSTAITDALAPYDVDLVVLAGFMCLYLFPDRYENRAINVHPALIPAFCGQGMYGHLAHEAVIEYGVKVSGCTVHMVDREYDHGPVILQRTVPVLSGDTADTLAERVMAEERIAYPEAIRLFAEDRIRVKDGKVRVLPGEWQPTSLCGLQE
jgi:formyltetrahydrofolate-dependent phosphoribosylglycinamide formyltransferase